MELQSHREKHTEKQMSLPEALGLGMGLQRERQFDQAESVYRQILAVFPECADAYHLLGTVSHACARPQVAINHISHAISLNPHVAAYHCNLGVSLRILARFDEAVGHFRKAISLDPKAAGPWLSLGVTYQQMGAFVESCQCFLQALEMDPTLIKALIHLVNLRLFIQRNETLARGCSEAIAALEERLLKLSHQNADLLCTLAVGYGVVGEFQRAEALFERAFAAEPMCPSHHLNKGLLEALKGNFSQSLFLLEKALELKPNFVEAIIEMGNLLTSLGDFERALDLYSRAESLRPGSPMCAYNRATALLASGQLPEGFRCYEARFAVGLANFGPVPFPRWQGEDLTDKDLLVCEEQGFGDCIQMVRYAQILAKKGARVSISCRPELHRLFSSIEGLHLIVTPDTSLEGVDYSVPIMSLPFHCGTNVATIPGTTSYLSAAPADEAYVPLPRVAGRLNVVCVWAGSPVHPNDRIRSCPWEDFKELFAVEGVHFFSLQPPTKHHDAKALGAFCQVTDMQPRIRDFADSAAIINQADLVVCVDTAVAHLAGALGKEVWVLLPNTHVDWRWMAGRTDSPWYPSMHLLRQPTPHDWAGLIAEVSRMLRLRVATAQGGRAHTVSL